MRMYLSSFKLGNQPEEFQRLAGPVRRAAIIMNALDNFPDQRALWLDGQTRALNKLGFSVIELDLRLHFERAGDLRAIVDGINAVWVNGGNAFILRRAMKQSGFDLLLKDALARDALVYAGFSAGAVICYRSMRGLELIDDANDAPTGYDPEIVWEGLGLLPYALVVHDSEEHANPNSPHREIAFYEANAIPYRAIRDGQALVVDGQTTKVAG
ncbi:MAG: Type 1 glutamine amidotransferase-like domain-containing protein [Rhodomicrobium sp.]